MTTGTGDVAANGLDDLRARFVRRCAEWPRARATRVRRTVVGDFLVDEEEFTDFASARVVAVYHVRDGLIDHVSILR